MAAPFTTNFAVKEKYKYLDGFGAYHSSEAFEGANPKVINSPQNAPYGLVTERLSGTSFTAPRHQNYQTWMYRSTASMHHSELVPHGDEAQKATIYTPNSYLWSSFDIDEGADWLSQKLLVKNGDPMKKSGLAIWVFNVDKDMDASTAFCSIDGDVLIIPQYGALDIQTELGHLLVRQNEIAVIPRAVRYRITLPTRSARGFICELYQGHFELPDLGAIGSTGLANVRDFQVPVAAFDGQLDGNGVAKTVEKEWKVVVRQGGRLWSYIQDQTPFDVAAWHGTFYPYKYDLARFCVMGNLAFDEHDPSMYVVLTANANKDPGTGVVDFAVLPPRWNVAEGTLWLPYYHRNIMTEFFGPINSSQHPKFPFNQPGAFMPFGAGMNGPLITHGASSAELKKAQSADLKPQKVDAEGLSIFLLETELPLYLSDWAADLATTNFRSESKL